MEFHLDVPGGGAGCGDVPAPKTSLPVLPVPLLHRPRFDTSPALLDRGPHAPGGLAVVTAPPGSGKTTMLADWARRRRRAGHPVAWLRLDAGDNDVARLGRALLTALAVGLGRPEPEPQAAVPRNRAALVAAVLAVLERHGGPLTLVLDDVHTLVEPVADDVLPLLAGALPPRVHVVLAGRLQASPGDLLPRLRLEGRVRELAPAELDLDRAETAQLLALHGLEVCPQGLDRLLARTEGWAGGLATIAALARRDGVRADEVDPERIEEVLGEYLLTQVVDRQPGPVRRFLLDTSVCRHLDEDLARELSGREDAGTILEGLVRARCFVRHDGAPDRYRYHPLLRHVLRRELSHTAADRRRDLERRAAGLLAGRGRIGHALEHAHRCGDPGVVAGLLREHGLHALGRGEGPQLRGALLDLQRHPGHHHDLGLRVLAATSFLEAGDRVGLEIALAGPGLLVAPAPGLLPAPAEPAPARLVRQLQALRPAADLLRARQTGCREALAQLLAAPPELTGEPGVDLWLLLEHAAARNWLGDQGAESELRSVLQMAERLERPWAAARAAHLLLLWAGARMDLDLLEQLARQLLASAPPDQQGGPLRRAARLALECAAHLRGVSVPPAGQDRVEATPHGRGHDPTGYARRTATVGELLSAVLDFATAEDQHAVVGTVRRVWEQRGVGGAPLPLVAVIAPLEQRMAYLVGEPVWADEALRRADDVLRDRLEGRLMRAVRHGHRGRPEIGLRLLVAAREETVPSVTPLGALETRVQEACLAAQLGEEHHAHQALYGALRLGAAQDLVRPFCWGGREVCVVLDRGMGRFGRVEEFARRVRAVCASPVEGGGAALTNRELQLLAELQAPATTGEIAASMYVSVNTVKTHLRGIYRKLGARNRREAVRLARHRGLL